MANSIIGSGQKQVQPQGVGPQMLQQLSEFKRNYTGDPKQAVSVCKTLQVSFLNADTEFFQSCLHCSECCPV